MGPYVTLLLNPSSSTLFPVFRPPPRLTLRANFTRYPPVMLGGGGGGGPKLNVGSDPDTGCLILLLGLMTHVKILESG